MDLSNLFGPNGALTLARAADPTGQPAAPAPLPAPSAAPLPTAPPSDYATFIKNLADAAAANIHTKTWSQRGLLTAANGDDLTAARANVIAGAPVAWDQFQAGHTGVQAGQVDLGQTLAYINAYRLAHGQTAVDVDNLTNSIARGAPTAKPSLPPDTGAPQPNADAEDRSALFTGLADAMPKMPGLGASPFAPSTQPPVTTMPLASPQANADTPGNVGAIMSAANSMPKGMPLAPQAIPGTPAVNPLDAQRANLGRMAMAMVGLPKFAAQPPEINKTISQGVPEGSAINYNTGAASDVFTGAPLSVGVNEDAANKAGGIATATEIPRVIGENAINDHATFNTRGNQQNEAGLQRGTDAARIGTENAYKAPTLFRAPDGSVVGVSPTQLAEASRTGALAGYRPLSDEDTKALGAMGEQYVKDQAALPDVRKTQNTIQTMLDQAKAFPPGTFGDMRASAGRLLTGIGANSDAVAKIVGSPAGADIVMKNTMTLAMDRLRQSFGQAREAGFVLNMAMKANPNIETQPEAYSFMLNTMNQEAQRQADYLTAQQAYRTQHGTIDGFTEAFDQARPIAAYANQAMVDTYAAPTGSRFLGRSQGKPVFQSPNGKKFVVTH